MFWQFAFRSMRLIGPYDRLVKIKKWVPVRDAYGIGWPVMLVDVRGKGRWTLMPIWNRARIYALCGRTENAPTYENQTM